MSEKILAIMRRSFTGLDAYDRRGYIGKLIRLNHFGGWKRVIWRHDDNCDY